jgi:hypothetical protein
LAAWCWEEGALGNVRIAAKRALLDTLTEEGRQQAQEHYQRMEVFLQEVCAEHGVPYTPELLRLRELYQDDAPAPVRMTIERYRGWSALEEALRTVPLRGDSTVRPYAASSLVLRRLRIQDLRPTAYYALAPRIAQLRSLYQCMLEQYALSLFDLSGMLDYTMDDRTLRMSPPVVERYVEPEEGREVAAIVDGQHRILLARELGFDEIWTVEVAQTSQDFPLVSLPLQWSDVRVVESVPETHAKRRFRFTALEQVPSQHTSQHTWKQKQAAPESLLYYFYRDLAALGSGGIRPSQRS